MTEATRQSNVVLPASSFAEKDGTFTSCVNKTGVLTPAVVSPFAWDHIKQIMALAASAGEPFKYKNTADIQKAMGRSRKPDTYKIRLAAAKKDSLLRSFNPATNALRARMMKFAAERGLK